MSGGEVGETNARIIADQFHKLKFGDRFFYSHEKDDSGNVPGLPLELRKQIFRFLNIKLIFDNLEYLFCQLK